LVDEKNNVIKEMAADQEGYFVFTEIPIGIYYITFDDLQIENLGYTNINNIKVELTKDDPVFFAEDIILKKGKFQKKKVSDKTPEGIKIEDISDKKENVSGQEQLIPEIKIENINNVNKNNNADKTEGIDYNTIFKLIQEDMKQFKKDPIFDSIFKTIKDEINRK
jgi:hypothetical protein